VLEIREIVRYTIISQSIVAGVTLLWAAASILHMVFLDGGSSRLAKRLHGFLLTVGWVILSLFWLEVAVVLLIICLPILFAVWIFDRARHSQV